MKSATVPTPPRQTPFTPRPNRVAVPGPVRLRRLKHGLTLAAVAQAAGMTMTRASFAERGAPQPLELRRLSAAITALVAKRDGVQS
jgi:hypothetical protein